MSRSTTDRDEPQTYDEQRSEHEKKIDAIVLRRVMKGIELLTERYGRDWASKVDLDRLDLASGQYCVLGQVYKNQTNSYESGFTAGCRILNLRGFSPFGEEDMEQENPNSYAFDTWDGVTYNDLHRVWKQELAELQ